MANAFAFIVAADEQQFRALMSAIQRHEPIEEWLQDEHRGVLSMGDHRDPYWTPLVCAAFNGNAGATALLLEAGVDVDQRTNSGFCSLFLACMRGHIECAELLLSAGASVNLANRYGGTPLFFACCYGHIQCAQLLSSYGANRNFPIGYSAERYSAYRGNHALTEWLALSREWSPLHHLEVLSPERTRALLRGGANLHFAPSTGDAATPLERARQLAPANASASLVVRAAGPWAVESHELFADAERTRAVTLVHSLYHVYLRRMEHGGWQAVDFARHVLSHMRFAGVR